MKITLATSFTIVIRSPFENGGSKILQTAWSLAWLKFDYIRDWLEGCGHTQQHSFNAASLSCFLTATRLTDGVTILDTETMENDQYGALLRDAAGLAA
jgi:hypothetical protein